MQKLLCKQQQPRPIVDDLWGREVRYHWASGESKSALEEAPIWVMGIPKKDLFTKMIKKAGGRTLFDGSMKGPDVSGFDATVGWT